MTDLSTTLENLRESLVQAFASFLAYLPYLVAALLLVLAGWYVARLVRKGAARLGDGLNALMRRFGRSPQARRPRLTPAVVALIGNVAFWLVILLFVTVAARVAKLDAFTTWLYQIVSYLPTLLAGGLILLAGYLVSTLVRDVVSTALDSAGAKQSEFFGLLAQTAVFLAALVIGLDQVGIDVTFLTILFGVVAAGLVFGIALAFGLGAREFVGNVVGAHQARELLAVGQVARVGDVEGQIIEFTPTSVILATDDGRLSVPAKVFQEQATLIVTADEHE